MRRLLRTRTRRLAAALTTAAAAALLALLAPGVSYAAGQSAAAAPARSSPALAVDGCTGVTLAVFPAAGFITDPDRSQAGHLWWRPEADGVCIGTVVEFVQYNTTATKTWQVIIYSAGHSRGQVVAARTFTLGPGWYYFGFGVHQVFPGLSQVCITADDSFGVSCVDVGQSPLRTCRAAGSGAPAVDGAGGVRDDHRERRDHQRHGRDDDRRRHRVPIQDGPGDDEQSDADRHKGEVEALVPARRLRPRQLGPGQLRRSRWPLPGRSVPSLPIARCQFWSSPLGASALARCPVAGFSNADITKLIRKI